MSRERSMRDRPEQAARPIAPDRLAWSSLPFRLPSLHSTAWYRSELTDLVARSITYLGLIFGLLLAAHGLALTP
jgi:hypothetical protein